MRSLILVALMAASAHAQPLDHRAGWCQQPFHPRPAITKSFEIHRDTFKVKPMRKQGFESYSTSHERFGQSRSLYLGFSTALVNGKVRFWTPEQWCAEMLVGTHDPCGGMPNRIVRPMQVLFEDPVAVPSGTCIGYAISLDNGAFAVGVGTEMRVYTTDDRARFTAVAKIKTAKLELVDRIDTGPVVFQEPNGPKWLARWDGKKVSLTRIDGIAGRVTSLAQGHDSHVYAFTDGALYKLDPTTLAVTWKLDGEIWGFLPQDVPKRLFVVAIDRSKTKPRVLLKLVDDSGKQLRETVVYEGEVKAAELNFVYDGIYVVHVST